VRPCPSCRHTADECSYQGEARPDCLRDKQIRDELNAKTEGVTAKELREQIKAGGRDIEKKG
jgi:hypothetical protein